MLRIARTNVTTSALSILGKRRILAQLGIAPGQIDDRGEGLRPLLSLYTLMLGGSPREVPDLIALPQVRIVTFREIADADQQALQQLQQRQPVSRVLVVKENSYYPHGHDPARDLAAIFISKQIKFEIASSGSVRSLPSVDAAKGKAFFFTSIEIPRDTHLSQDERKLLVFAGPLSIAFRAMGAQDADGLLRSLSHQPCLFEIQLDESDLTDFGLQEVTKNMPGLKKISITKTAVTPGGIEAFRKLMPRCRVVSDFGTVGP